MNLCPHKLNAVACLQCFHTAQKAPRPAPKSAAVSPMAGTKSVLDRIKERDGGNSGPVTTVDSAPLAVAAPKVAPNPHAGGSNLDSPVDSGEPLWEPPVRPKVFDRLPRRGDT